MQLPMHARPCRACWRIADERPLATNLQGSHLTAGSSPARPENMRLSRFVQENREAILAEWEEFARTCTPSSRTMDITALRDHADEMLTVIAADLTTPQSGSEQQAKGTGNAPDIGDTVTAAEEHGSARANSGFTIDQMVAEYRALRASVIRLWTKRQQGLDEDDIEDLTRFNEAIDQSLAESVAQYTADLDRSKEMFLAILGHDLRTPLGAILASASYISEAGQLKEPFLTLTARIASSTRRMVQMVGDLLDFTRSTLGGGIPIARVPMNMEQVARDAVDEIAAVYPGRTMHVEVRGEQGGVWDRDRIGQALTNLLGNALDHGSQDAPVTVDLAADAKNATIRIHNAGVPIPPERLDGIFNPMKSRRTRAAASSGPWGSLGLGLYIAERIVAAHAGTIDVESSEESGTTFIVQLPRTSSAEASPTPPSDPTT
jgi:signal transduction histidine kinase